MSIPIFTVWTEIHPNRYRLQIAGFHAGEIGITDRRHHHEAKDPPSLVPSGPFDKIFLVGGENQTTSQSLALGVTRLCVSLGIGMPIIRMDFYGESEIGRYGYHKSRRSWRWGGVLILLGALMVVTRVPGIARPMLKRNRS
jgi:hypothetical protein